MNKAIILHGPSGAGKSTLAFALCKKYGYVHCDSDAFKPLISPIRSVERSRFSEQLAVAYAKLLVAQKKNLILEAISPAHLAGLKQQLKRAKYVVTDVSLVADKEICVIRDSTRTTRKYGATLIREIHGKYSAQRGIVIDVNKKTTAQVIRELAKQMKL